MAFETYQCEQYIKYLQKHEKTMEDIYELLSKSPYTWTQLGHFLNYDYYSFKRRVKLRLLTNDELITLLGVIK